MENLRLIVNRRPALRRLLLPLIIIRRFFIKRKLAHMEQIYQNLCDLLEDYPVIRLKEFRGIFQINPRQDIFKRILFSKQYEPEYVNLCLRYLDINRDVIDVGANVGFYSVLFANVIKNERKVLAIEPIRDMINLLRRNIKLNNLEGKIIVFEGAVSNTESTASIKVCPGKEEYSTLGSWSHPSILQNEYFIETVKVSTLDNLVKIYFLNPGFIKIDVEGMEHLVLDGAKNILTVYRPIVVSELSDPLLRNNGSSALEVINMFKNHKYKVLDAYFMDEHPERRKYTEIICIPEELT